MSASAHDAKLEAAACPETVVVAAQLGTPLRCPNGHPAVAGSSICAACGTFIGDQSLIPPASAHLPEVPGYEILAELGRGGMGVVYKARHLQLQRLVALKMVLHGDFADADLRQRFQREAEAVARLQHPHIVQLYEIGEVGRSPFFSLEFIEGQSLADRLHGQPLPPHEAASLVETLAQAVHFAHQHGIIHRDLKPANILIADCSESASRKPQAAMIPKIADFGLAKRLDEAGPHTQSGAILGTPSYMAPEQASGSIRAIGAATDVYALGAILYELLTGRPPFLAPTPMETVAQVLQHEPAPVRRLQAHVPRDLETICLKCLHKEPARRYASAAALAQDLRRFLEGQPIQARRTGVSERVLKWVRRRPTLAALAALTFVFALTAGAASVWYLLDRDARAQQLAEEASRWQALEKEVGTLLAGDTDKARTLHTLLANEHKVDELRSSLAGWSKLLAERQALLRQVEKVLTSSEGRIPQALTDELQAHRASFVSDTALLHLAGELDDIHHESFTTVEVRWRPAAAGPRYQSFFQERLQLDIANDAPQQLAVRIAASPLRHFLLAALDHWAELSQTPDSRYADLLPRLLRIARLAQPEPWRDRFRQEEVWEDRKQLESLAATVKPAAQTSQILIALAAQLDRHGGNGVELLKAALVQYPHSFWLNLNIARLLKDEKAQVGYYQAALALRPDSIVAYNNLGVALSAQNNHAEAETAYRKALKLRPHPILLNNLGCVLQKQQQPEQAIAHFQQAIALQPDYAMAYRSWGNLLYDRQDLDAAAEKYARARALDPTYAMNHYSLGRIHDKQGDRDQAIICYRRALELGAKNASVCNFLGVALGKLQHYPEAAAAYANAVRLQPESVQFQKNLGIAQRRMGKLGEAAAACKQAAVLKPQEATLHLQLARTLLALERFAEARLAVVPALLLLPTADKDRPDADALAAECERCLKVLQAESNTPEDFTRGFSGMLTEADPLEIHQRSKRRSYRKVHVVRLVKDTNYQIDLRADFDSVLRIEAVEGGHLARNDDVCPPEERDARVLFTPPHDGLYKLVVNSFAEKATGKYTLRLHTVEPLPQALQLEYRLTSADKVPLAKLPASVAQALEKRYAREHRMLLQAGVPYVFLLNSVEFTTFLMLRDPLGNRLAFDAAKRPSDWWLTELHFTPRQVGEYTLLVTSNSAGETGSYVLKVQGYQPAR